MELNVEDDLSWYSEFIVISSLPGQDVALISLKFSNDFAHELANQWKLIDPLGKVHLVSYEKNARKPFLFKGLPEIRNYYSLEGLNWCLLKYQGFSNFDLFIYNTSIEEVCYLPPSPAPVLAPPPPVGHVSIPSQAEFSATQNIKAPEYILYPCFFVTRLSPNQASSSQMNLPAHVYEYLRHGQVYNWLMRGPTGKEVQCKILGVPRRTYARFGKGWRSFCKTHRLKEGDTLTFFFTCENVAFIDVLIHDQTS